MITESKTGYFLGGYHDWPEILKVQRDSLTLSLMNIHAKLHQQS